MYENLLRDSRVEDFERLNQAWKSHWTKGSLREGVENLWDVEEQWDEFLTNVDKVLMSPKPSKIDLVKKRVALA